MSMSVDDAIELARTLIRHPHRGGRTTQALERLDGPDAVREALEILEVEFLVGMRVNPYTFPQARDTLKAALAQAE